MKTYKIAIIGEEHTSELLVEYLSASERFNLCSLYEKNKVHCKELASRYQVTGYDDFRQLIQMEKPEIIVLSLPNYQAGDCISTAVALGCNIFKKYPVARDYSESQCWIAIAQKSQCAFAVSCPTRNNPIYDYIAGMILTDKAIGTLYYSSISNFQQFEGVLDWRGEPKMSGGGVLLEGNFAYFDLLVRICGIPQRVFAVTSDLCKKISIPPYLTEDTAQVTMEYPDKSIANLSCGWMAGVSKMAMSFYGTEGSIHSDGITVSRYNRKNELVEEQCFDKNKRIPEIAQLELFADHLDNRMLKLNCNAAGFNETIATINSAYLSATTKTPEEPAKLIAHI